MRQLRGLAVEAASEKATTQDVTEVYSDAQSQIARWKPATPSCWS